MGRWRRYVVSKMQWQVFRRRESNSKQNHLEEEVLSEMQIQLSDIGSIREAQSIHPSKNNSNKNNSKTTYSCGTNSGEEEAKAKAKTHDV